ncbi:cation efflux system protein [Escherichia coli]|uniref:Cation efflux system protein n=1 Tax=Escherichia coli TaxID=562 RepID=A0A376UGA4_ECOLX|nr:cation efflux system protein [Escherichia coli]
MIAGGIISAAGFTWFAKAEPPAEKTSTAERKILFWYDPMYPNTRFDKPGKSPFMDMDLVPKYADEEILRLVCALTRLRRRIWG